MPTLDVVAAAGWQRTIISSSSPVGANGLIIIKRTYSSVTRKTPGTMEAGRGSNG